MSEQHEPGTDLVRQAAAEAAPEVGRFLGTVFGSASFELDGMLGAYVNQWRLKRWIKAATRSKEMLDAAGLTAQQVPFRTAVPLMEAASLEDDENLVDRWAGLLANAASSEADDVPPSFPNVLRELEPDGARVLDLLHDQQMALAEDFRREFSIYLDEEEKPAKFHYHVDNLQRLGLVRSAALDEPTHYETLNVTAFGEAFVRACRAPGTELPPVKWHSRDALQEHIAERDAAGGLPPEVS